VPHGEPREQAAAVLLEHDRHAGRRAGDADVAEHDLAGGRIEQAGDALEQRGLAGARRADDAQQLAGRARERQIADRLDDPAVAVVHLAEVADVEQRGHASPRCGRRSP
jgi:hypothetical protein